MVIEFSYVLDSINNYSFSCYNFHGFSLTWEKNSFAKLGSNAKNRTFGSRIKYFILYIKVVDVSNGSSIQRRMVLQKQLLITKELSN